MTQSLNIGYELVFRANNTVSFRIKRSDGSGGAETIQGMDCPMWFRNSKAARQAANVLIQRVMDQLRQSGFKVNRHSA